MANKHVTKHLNKLLYSRIKLLEIPLEEEDKYVFFSDLHRGLSDVADDFTKKNQESYYKALLYYLDQGYTLVLLGDIEELEEQSNIRKVMQNQKQALQLEILFYRKNRLIKIFGNHDDKWEKDKNVAKYLQHKDIFPNITVYEGILFTQESGNKILAVHGHQGAIGSDIWPWLEVFLPVYRWGLNLVGKNRHNEFKDICMVGDREQHLYDWISNQKDTIMICGHTHRPVWGGTTHAEKIKDEIDALNKQISEVAEQNGIEVSDTIRRSVEFGIEEEVILLGEKINQHNLKVKDNGMCNIKEKPLPLYYNTGCCIYSDGDITGIEIDRGELRLIKWGYNNGDPIREVLEDGVLEDFY